MGPGLLAAIVAVSLALTSALVAAAAPVVNIRTLVKLPENFRKRAYAVTSDGNHCAHVERLTNGERMVYRGERGPIFPQIAQPVIAEKSHKLFYWAGDPAGDATSLVLVADGVVLKTNFAKPQPIIFSADGTRWAVAGGLLPKDPKATKAEGVAVFVDGKQVGEHKDTTWPAFSPDGTHVAYIAQESDESFGLIVDGTRVWKFDRAEGKTAMPVVQGDIGPNLSQLFTVKYLSDGSLLLVAMDKDGYGIYRNGTRLASYPTFQTTHGNVNFDFGDELRTKPAFLGNSFGIADNAPVAAWWERLAGDEGLWRVSIDGVPMQKTCKLYWENNPPFLSRDGRQVAYQCWSIPPGVQPETRADMMFGETSLGSFHNIWGIGISDDGQHVAFAGSLDRSEDGWRFYLDGRYYAMRYIEAWRPRISPDGKHVAWEGKRGKRGVLVLDGDSRGSFDEVLWGPEFVLPETVSWVIRRGNRIVRVDAGY